MGPFQVMNSRFNNLGFSSLPGSRRVSGPPGALPGIFFRVQYMELSEFPNSFLHVFHVLVLHFPTTCYYVLPLLLTQYIQHLMLPCLGILLGTSMTVSVYPTFHITESKYDRKCYLSGKGTHVRNVTAVRVSIF